MKTLSELEEAVPYDEAQERAIATHQTVTYVRRQAALDLVRDGEANPPPLTKDLSKALKAESDALSKLDAARTAREAAAAVQDTWNVMMDQLAVLKNRCLRAEQQIEQVRVAADALRGQVALELGGSDYVDVPALAGNAARLESAVPIMERGLEKLKADAEKHISQTREFAKKHSVPPEVVP